MRPGQNAADGAELITRGARRIHNHLSGIAEGGLEITRGLRLLLIAAARWLMARAMVIGLSCLRFLRKLFVDMRTIALDLRRTCVARSRHFLQEAKRLTLQCLANPWAWAAAIAVPVVSWLTVHFFVFASDPDAIELLLQRHPIAAWTVLGLIGLLELLVIGPIAVSGIRRFLAAALFAIRSLWHLTQHLYSSLPTNVRAFLRHAPRALLIAAMGLQIAISAAILWFLLSRIPTEVWPTILLVGTSLVSFLALTWINRRWLQNFAKVTKALLTDLSSTIGKSATSRLRSAMESLRKLSSLLSVALRTRLGRLIAMSQALRNVRLELALISHRGTKSRGPQFGISLIQASILGLAIVSIGFVSYATLDVSGIQLGLFDPVPGAESASTQSPADSTTIFDSVSAFFDELWNGTLTQLDRLRAWMGELLPQGRMSMSNLPMLNGMTPTRYVWSHGAHAAFEPFPHAETQRFGIGPICRSEAVLALGTASSDGSRVTNEQLALARSRHLAGMLATWANACPEPPLVIAISLGENSSATSSPLQRELLALSVELPPGIDLRQLPMEDLQTLLLSQEEFAGVVQSYNGFDACEFRPAPSTQELTVSLPQC